MPALLTRISMRPSALIVSSRARSTSAYLVTSTTTDARRPRFCSSPAVFFAKSTSRSQIATVAPDSRKRSTIARPMPCAPPVTTALRPLRSILFAMTPPAQNYRTKGPKASDENADVACAALYANNRCCRYKTWGTRRSPRLSKACEPKRRLLRLRRGPVLFAVCPENVQRKSGDKLPPRQMMSIQAPRPSGFGSDRYGWNEPGSISRGGFFRQRDVRYFRLRDGPCGFRGVVAHHYTATKRASHRVVRPRHPGGRHL